MAYEWIGPLIQAGGSIAGEALSAGDKKKQLDQLLSLQKLYGDIGLPELERIIAQEVPDSSLSSYTPNANYQTNQDDVLARLGEMDKGGGFGVEDKADMARIGQQVAQQQRASRAGLQAALQRRGATGSGEDYASQIALAQSGAQQANQAGLDTSKMALQRRMQALSQRGSLATQLRNQDFGEKSTIAQAQDAIRKYNAEARQNAAGANNQNAMNTFLAQIQRANGMSGAGKDVSAQYGQNAADTRALGSGLGRAGNEAYRAYNNPTAYNSSKGGTSANTGQQRNLTDADIEALRKAMGGTNDSWT